MGGFLKWWYPPFHTPKWSNFSRSLPMGLLGTTHHFRKHLHHQCPVKVHPTSMTSHVRLLDHQNTTDRLSFLCLIHIHISYLFFVALVGFGGNGFPYHLFYICISICVWRNQARLGKSLHSTRPLSFRIPSKKASIASSTMQSSTIYKFK